jgi:HPt (histidine-containing phosphotransfer) domain-containing protein
LRSVSGNNEEFIREMIHTFIHTIPPILTEMNVSVSEKDWSKLSRLAHQIKPSLALMGMDELRTKVILIEEHGKANTNIQDLTTITNRFIHLCEEIIPQLSKFL